MGDTSKFDSFCRICAKEQTCSVYVFSEAGKQLYLEEKMKKYLHIMIHVDDRLPKTICINCCTHLDNMDKFVKLALEAQEHLTELLHNEEKLFSNPIDYSKSSDFKFYPDLIKEEISEIESNVECDNVGDIDMKIDPLLFVQCSLGDSINLAESPLTSPKININTNALLAEHNYYISSAEDRISSPLEIKKENESDSISDEDVKLDIAQLNCALCSQTFSNNTDLRNHFWLHISNCKQDNSDTNISQSINDTLLMPQLKRHIQMDSTYIPCPICGKKLSTKGNLKVHLETHSPKGKYACDICGRVFRSEQNLSSHKECHTVAYKFTCEVCKRVYPTSSTLRAHSITHSNARPHACSLCNKTFKRNQDLKFHLNQHTGARPYQCPYCPKAFASSGNCFSHRKRMHLNELERDRELAAAIVS